MMWMMKQTMKYTLLATLVTVLMLFAHLGRLKAEENPYDYSYENDVVDVPVLTQRVRKGDIIDESMVTMVSFAERRLPRYALLDPNDVIGHEAMRNLSEDRPIMSRNVRIPPFGRKGELVTVLYNKGGLNLQIQGELMADASKGDEVRVRSSDSKNIVVGRMVSPGLVQAR